MKIEKKISFNKVLSYDIKIDIVMYEETKLPNELLQKLDILYLLYVIMFRLIIN